MYKKTFCLILIIFQLGVVIPARALQMPTSGNELAAVSGLNAKAYIVKDAKTGEVLLNRNADEKWIPASLTKLVTALVVLDTKPRLSKTVAMTAEDQRLGACAAGGACIKSKSGVRFTVDALFHAALIPSANNATHALARSTGLSPQEFAARMNEKARSLGANNSYFYEPTGLDTQNVTTPADYTAIVQSAFSNAYLRKIAGLSAYYLKSSNNSSYNQTIKNTDKLLKDADVQMLGAKTGYLTESGYNFASLLKYRGNQELVIVVMGADRLSSVFEETKKLARLAEDARGILAFFKSYPVVLGASSQPVGLTMNEIFINQLKY